MLHDPLFLLAINLSIVALIRILCPNMVTGLMLAVVLMASTVYLGGQHGTEVLVNVYRGRDLVLSNVQGKPTWPPEKFRSYPDLRLVDSDGGFVQLSDYRGKVILVQPFAMTSPACVAYAGGNRYGKIGSTEPQPDLRVIDDYARRFGRVSLEHDELVFIQLMLFNAEMQVPTVDDLKLWADHFRMTKTGR